MEKIFRKSVVAAVALLLLNASVLFAQNKGIMGSGSGHPHMKNHGTKTEEHQKAEMAHGQGDNKHGDAHFFGDNWKNTLDDTQKISIDKLHLTLKKKIKPLSTMLEVKNAELTNIVTEDKADMQAIKNKIKEILEIKQIIMEQKYAHKIDMRSILTESQKVSFDLSLINDSDNKMH